MQRKFSHYVYCQPCREAWGEVWTEASPNRQVNVNQPMFDTKRFESMPKRCPNCDTVLVRKES